MSTSEEFRTKATNYGLRAQSSQNPVLRRYFLAREKEYTAVADDERWLSASADNPIHLTGNKTLAAEEEHILRCLGAAVMMEWHTLPRKLQRELLDTAGSLGDLLKTKELRGQIARFLHDHMRSDVLGKIR
jgi:hypothetical protein